jgi:hypothetical protein
MRDEALKLALEALEAHADIGIKSDKAITAIKQALAAPVQEPLTDGYVQQVPDKCDRIVWRNRYFHLPIATPPAAQPALVQEPVKLRRGDILRCIETDELCTVWATSTTGKTLVKWSANNFGDYTAEQIGELFWIEPKLEQEPVGRFAQFTDGIWREVTDGSAGVFLYPTPPAQPAVPDEITDNSESPEYRSGWNDCRALMLENIT